MKGHVSAILVPALLATAQQRAPLGCWLNEEGILKAMCLTISMAADVKGQFSAESKPLHASGGGKAAALAVSSPLWPP
ncbi:hypothetical protein BG74_06735 [Sodalis-like endosymbiont of Proechinophthirus fluctus]|nr:hypothetical protein BG74_06735 [Sodalis-like endosymbiont of Proechinophthirus fluctus]